MERKQLQQFQIIQLSRNYSKLLWGLSGLCDGGAVICIGDGAAVKTSMKTVARQLNRYCCWQFSFSFSWITRPTPSIQEAGCWFPGSRKNKDECIRFLISIIYTVCSLMIDLRNLRCWDLNLNISLSSPRCFKKPCVPQRPLKAKSRLTN